MPSLKRVTFDDGEDKMIASTSIDREITKDMRKTLWYRREDLRSSCDEAKVIINTINMAGGDMNAIDHSLICVVGLEKYQNVEEREKTRRFLIRSILVRQEMNRSDGRAQDADGLCEISETLSKSFRDFAQWQGKMHVVHAWGTPTPPRNVKKRVESRIPPLQAKRRRSITGYC
jgi:hypothetical protein